MKKRNTDRWSKGFTMTETIIVVAILAVLMATALPFLQKLLVDLEMTRVNNAAKQIYLAAQNRMIFMRSAGTLSSDITGNSELKPVVIDTDALVFADNATTVMQSYILPAGTITDDVRGKGYYVVVFDEIHGLLQEVYFSERPLSVGGTVEAGTLSNWRDNAATRRNQRVGFYSGAGEASGRVLQMPELEMALFNDEELYARIILPDTTSTGLGSSDLVIKLKVENAEDSAQFVELELTPYVRGDDNFDLVEDYNRLNGKVLDSLKKPFATRFPGITLGANIRVSAVLGVKSGVDTGDVIYRDSNPVVQTSNSLFNAARVQTVSSPGGGAEKRYLSLDVSQGRHLSNLNLITDPRVPIAGVDQEMFFVYQTDRIYYGSGGAWEFAYPSRDTPMIKNERLLTYDGGGHEVVELNKPMFYRFGGAALTTLSTQGYKIENVRIFSPKVDYTVANPAEYYGTLVCTANGTLIDNCHIYGYEGRVEVEGTTSSGGLVGLSYGSPINSSSVAIPMMEVEMISSDPQAAVATVGGLVGEIYMPVSGRTVSISDCYVDIGELKVEGAYVGMLMGNNRQGTTMNRCYTVGKITGTALQAGGLIGADVNSATPLLQHINDCYTLVDLRGINAIKFAALPNYRSAIHVENIYYVADVTGTAQVDNGGKSTAITLADLAAGSTGGSALFPGIGGGNPVWKVGNTPGRRFAGNRRDIYPYPSIVRIGSHNGDWP